MSKDFTMVQMSRSLHKRVKAEARKRGIRLLPEMYRKIIEGEVPALLPKKTDVDK